MKARHNRVFIVDPDFDVPVEVLAYRQPRDVEYRVGGWPCPVDYLANVFNEIHSGRPVSWL